MIVSKTTGPSARLRPSGAMPPPVLACRRMAPFCGRRTKQVKMKGSNALDEKASILEARAARAREAKGPEARRGRLLDRDDQDQGAAFLRVNDARAQRRHAHIQ